VWKERKEKEILPAFSFRYEKCWFLSSQLKRLSLVFATLSSENLHILILMFHDHTRTLYFTFLTKNQFLSFHQSINMICVQLGPISARFFFLNYNHHISYSTYCMLWYQIIVYAPAGLTLLIQKKVDDQKKRKNLFYIWPHIHFVSSCLDHF